MMYNKVVMDHFRNPRNVGTIEDADGIGEVGNPLCGDMMTIYLRVRDDRIEDIKFQTFGCGSAIAVSSMLTEMAKGQAHRGGQTNHQPGRGRSPGRAAQEQAALLEPRSGRPADRDQGLRGPQGRQIARPEPKRKDEHEHSHGDSCYCPYCDVEIEEGVSFCEACQHDLKEAH